MIDPVTVCGRAVVVGDRSMPQSRDEVRFEVRNRVREKIFEQLGYIEAIEHGAVRWTDSCALYFRQSAADTWCASLGAGSLRLWHDSVGVAFEAHVDSDSGLENALFCNWIADFGVSLDYVPGSRTFTRSLQSNSPPIEIVGSVTIDRIIITHSPIYRATAVWLADQPLLRTTSHMRDVMRRFYEANPLGAREPPKVANAG